MEIRTIEPYDFARIAKHVSVLRVIIVKKARQQGILMLLINYFLDFVQMNKILSTNPLAIRFYKKMRLYS